MYWYAYPNQIRDQIRCKYIKYAPYFIESLDSTFRLLLLGDTSDDSVPPLYMSTDTREYCINMPYSSTCQIRIKYTSNTQSNTSKYGCTWRTTPVGWVHVKYASNTQSNTIKYGCTLRTTLVGWVNVKFSSIHQILKQIQANMGIFGARSRSTRIYYDIWRVLTVLSPKSKYAYLNEYLTYTCCTWARSLSTRIWCVFDKYLRVFKKYIKYTTNTTSTKARRIRKLNTRKYA